MLRARFEWLEYFCVGFGCLAACWSAFGLCKMNFIDCQKNNASVFNVIVKAVKIKWSISIIRVYFN